MISPAEHILIGFLSMQLAVMLDGNGNRLSWLAAGFGVGSWIAAVLKLVL